MTIATEKRRALGRGLDALLPARDALIPARPDLPVATSTPLRDPGVHEIAVDLIDPNPYQTRRQMDAHALAELTSSISANGVIQPVVLRASGTRFQLIAGERRWLASQRAGKTTISAVIKEVSNEQALEMTIVENIQREDLNPMEHARAFDRLAREFSLTQEQMAQRTGKERTTIANYMRLMKLPDTVQHSIEGGDLSFGHAKILVGLDPADLILKAARYTIEHRLSVRGLEDLIESWNSLPQQSAVEPKSSIDPNVRAAQDDLERRLGCRVEVRDRKGKGKIVIHYATLEDFDRVVEALGGH